MQISAKEVAELRRRTSAGLMDSKKALQEAGGDMDKAIELLKEWGIAKAAKKGDRGATEGRLVAVISETYDKGALIEVNCETDFVANNKDFVKFADEVANLLFKAGITDTKEIPKEIQDRISLGISTFGENIIISSIQTIAGPGVLGAYIHTNGKNGTIVHLEGTVHPSPEFLALARDVAIHTAANTVSAVDASSIDNKVLEARKQEYIEEVKAQGKSEEIAKKIVEGKLQKFFKEETLLEQPYLKNEDITVKQHIMNIGNEHGAKDIRVKGFVKKIIGE